MRRARGFTLIELLVVMILLLPLSLAAHEVAGAVRRADRSSRAHTRELTELRRAVRAVEAGLREAGSVADLPVRLEEGRLVRDGRVLARAVESFEVAEADGVASVRIDTAGRPEISFRVRMRNAGGPR